MDKTQAKFVDYAANLNYANLTPGAIHSAKRSIIDSVGCAIGAFDCEPAKAARAYASQVTCKRPATLFGTKIKSSPDLAAFVNGTMIRYLDFSDDYFSNSNSEQGGPHPSDSIGGIWAAAESAGRDGKALILGTTLAYEVDGQLVDRMLLDTKGWDYPIWHAIATSLAAGKVIGLSHEQLAHAVAIATVSNISTRQARVGQLSHWNRCTGPNGSRNGLFAALVAKDGMTGPDDPFEGRVGLMKQLNCPFELGVMGGEDGTPFKMELTYYKYFPAVYQGQILIWMAFDLRKQVKMEDIASIDVFIDGQTINKGVFNPERYEPKTAESANHSPYYIIGAALKDGEITERTTEEARFRDPAMLAFIKNIRVKEDPAYSAGFPKNINCRFEVALRSGKKIVVKRADPKGHPANPMTDQEINDKFFNLVEPRFSSKQQANALLDQLWNLEKLDDVSKPFANMLVKA